MSLNHLKHIPCPAGDSCTSFKCLFQHREDRDRIGSETVRPEHQPAPKQGTRRKQDDTDPTNAEIERPQKRLKAELNSPSTAATQTRPKPTGKQAAAGVTAGDTSPPKMAIAAVNPVPSPPPGRWTTGRNPKPGYGSVGKPASAPNTPLKTSSTSAPKSAPKSAAHKPTNPTTPTPKAKKPEILNPRMVKPPPAKFETRYKLLHLLYQQFARLNGELKRDANDEEEKLVLSDQELIVRANEEEEKIAIEKAPTYVNVIKNRIMQHKKMSVAQWKEERVKERKAAQKKHQIDAPLGPPVEIKTGLTPAQEVKLLSRLLTPVESLGQHGYVSSVPTDEDVEKSRRAYETAQGWEKCDRCEKRFQVFPGRREEDGALTTGSVCVYHPGKTFWPEKPSRDAVQQTKRYRCCGENVGDSAGCTTGQHHVFKTTDTKRLASVLNYAKTPENGETNLDRAVCFDCEMGYTVYGLELVRLTATSWPTGELLLDVLVKPKGEILDLNSRYSGVWPQDIANAEPWTGFEKPRSSHDDGSDEQPRKRKLQIVESPQAARDLLFSLLTPDTPLIGHGLENDMNAVRIIHPTIIDTVLLYPHCMGLPYRHGLKMLTSQRLNKVIQVENADDIQGHDSAEDARAAGELVRLKVMEEWKKMQREGWKLVDGDFVAPGAKLQISGVEVTHERHH